MKTSVIDVSHAEPGCTRGSGLIGRNSVFMFACVACRVVAKRRSYCTAVAERDSHNFSFVKVTMWVTMIRREEQERGILHMHILIFRTEDLVSLAVQGVLVSGVDESLIHTIVASDGDGGEELEMVE